MRTSSREITVYNQELETVNQFKYLESLLKTNKAKI